MFTVVLSLLKKPTVLLSILVGILFIALLFTYQYASKQREEKTRYENNYTTLKDGLTYYETKDGQVYGKGGVLELKLKDLNKKEFDSIKDELKKYNIKLRNVKTIIRDSTSVSNSFNVFVRDSIVTDSITLKVAHWGDNWTTFNMVQINDSATVNYSTKLDLLQIISKKPRGWNVFSSKFWKPRYLEQVITTSNPHAKISYSQIVEIKKK